MGRVGGQSGRRRQAQSPCNVMAIQATRFSSQRGGMRLEQRAGRPEGLATGSRLEGGEFLRLLEGWLGWRENGKCINSRLLQVKERV
jgi:hypothetical protein